jgi:peptidoglycan-associated lipoprotein
MKKYFYLSMLFLLLSATVFGQQKYIDEALFYFRVENFCEGAAKAELAYKKINPKSPKAKKLKGQMAFLTAESYRFTEKFSNATDWYDKAILLRYYEIEPKVYLYNAEMYRAMGDFNPAEENYKAYLKLVPGDKQAENGLKAVQLAKNYVANRTRYTVKNETKINKSVYDYSPMLGDKKGSELYFTSSRPGSVGSSKDPRTCEQYTDIWVTKIDKKGNFSQPMPLVGEKINTDDNEGSVCFDGRFKTMFFTRCPNVKKQNLGCEIWMSESGSKGWGEPVKLNLVPDGPDSVSVGHPCVTPDGKFLIFASDMPGGQGGRDLWYVEFDRRSNSWSAPKNMGPEINTPGNELFPTFGLDGSLFFASDGHMGMGGLDIFKASRVGQENKWTKPVNMGFPINSVSNDYGLVELDERRGFFTSNRKSSDSQGEYTDDIWSYELPPNLFTLKVVVVAKGDNAPIENASIKITGSDGATWEGVTNDLGEVYFEKKGDGSRYINEETAYEIMASKDGEGDKGFYPNDGGITTVGLKQNQDFVKQIVLLPKRPIRLPEVRYDLAQATLQVNDSVNSKDSLNFVIGLLEEYPTLIIQLTSHTDWRGSAASNKDLSQRRAQACVDYLVNEKGVDPRRLRAYGAGRERPRTIYLQNGIYSVEKPASGEYEEVVLTNDYINKFKANKGMFERLHQYNRRTEGEVVSFDFNPETAGEKKIEIGDVTTGEGEE